jgi:hypothetical protein
MPFSTVAGQQDTRRRPRDESEKLVGHGEGGSNEDEEYFDLPPNI